MAEFRVRLDDTKHWTCSLHGEGGARLLTSEPLKSKADALAWIEVIRVISQDRDRYKNRSAAPGIFYFTLVDEDAEAMGLSEVFLTVQSREEGIDVVIATAPTAPLAEDAPARRA